jgi:hypothetical protein
MAGSKPCTLRTIPFDPHIKSTIIYEIIFVVRRTLRFLGIKSFGPTDEPGWWLYMPEERSYEQFIKKGSAAYN